MDFIVIDFETTGLSAKENRIIEIGYAIIKDGEIVERYGQLVNPGTPITNPKITELTGIENHMLVDAPLLEVEMRKLHAVIEGKLIIAHNAAFDMGFLNNTFYRMGLTTYHSSLCTSKMFRAYKKELGITLSGASLAVMTEYFDVVNEEAHRAKEDAVATAECFIEMCEDIDFRGHMDGPSKRSKDANNLTSPTKTDKYMRLFDAHTPIDDICELMKVKISTVSKYLLAWLQYAPPVPYKEFILSNMPEQKVINEILRHKGQGKNTAMIHRELGGSIDYFIIQLIGRMGMKGVSKLMNDA